MTKYTADDHALPYPEGVDKVAVHSDIQALAAKTGIAISTEGSRVKAAAEQYADSTKAAAIADAASRYGALPGRITDVEKRNMEQADRGLLPMTGAEQYSMLWRDPSGRIAEPAAVDAYGNTPDWVLERWSERMADFLQADMGVKPRFAIAAQGDSMTERYQNIGGTSWTDVLASELGVPVVNLGKSGQSSTEVAVRVGGVPFRATVAGNTIPASGAVGLTAYTPTTFWRTTLEHHYPGTLAGVPGVLRQNVGSPVTFHFIRDEPGSAVPCPPNSLFVPAQAKYLKWTPIIWVGRNNIGDGFVQQAIADIDAIVDSLPFPGPAKRFLVFSVCNAQAEPRGSTGYARVMEINNHLRTSYPDQYVDVRAWLRDSALGAMGLAPDAADTAAIAEDRIPPRLMQDNLHITEAAGQALGRYVVTVIKQKGLLL